ncbi:MAG: HDOD domain-containing protein [Fuerstiella sp.]
MSSSLNEPSTTSTFSWSSLCADALSSVSGCNISSEVQIPTFPAALMEFMKAAEDPDVEIRKLGKIIEYDPGLTLGLLKCVNVCTYGSQTRVRTAAEALVRMGLSGAKTYLMIVGLQSSTMSFESKLLNHRNFWNESMQKALFARHAAELLNTDTEFAFMGGMLQDYILPILTNQYDAEYLEYLKRDARDGRPLHEWEQERFGWNHASIGAYVASQWHLPDDLLCTIFLHHFIDLPLQAPEVELFSLFPATLAALLPDQLRQVPNGLQRLLRADRQSKAFDLDSLTEKVDAELETITQGHDRPVCLKPAVDTARSTMESSA